MNIDKTKRILSYTLILAINFMFAFKYLAREIDYALVISMFYTAFIAIAYFLLPKISSALFESDLFYYTTLGMYLIGHIILFHFIKVESLNVDRWSVISSFWEATFNGNCPYNAQSHMGNYPGPMPFYFVLALPFQLIGEIGYFSILGVILLAFFLRKTLTCKESTTALIILFLSVPIFWEISVRSTILINSVWFMGYLYWLLRADLTNNKLFWATATIGGLLLSTRTIFAIPMIIYGIYQLKEKSISFKLLFKWSVITCGVFAITFSPFLFFYFKEFLARNPFSVQTEHLLPLHISLFFIALAFFAGFICSDKIKILSYTVSIFVLILITYYGLVSYKYGFMEAYLNSYFDLSYMLFVFPFLLLFSFNEYKNRIKT